MSNLHRIQWIDTQIRAERFPNCRTIAQKFEITRRQASRDIEYLRYSLGAPVEYDPKRNGYTYSEAGFEIPKETITSEDASLLEELSRSYSRINSAEGKRIADLFTRLYRGTVGTNTISPGSKQLPDARALIELCIRAERDIQLVYIDAGNSRTVRRVTPQRIFQQGMQEYVEGLCHMRAKKRQFRFDRIVKIEPLDDSVSSAVPAAINHNEYAAPTDDSGTMDVVDTTGKTPLFTREPFIAEIRTGWGFRTTKLYKFYSSMELISWLLRHNPVFEIVKPRWLRTKTAVYFEKLHSFHNG